MANSLSSKYKQMAMEWLTGKFEIEEPLNEVNFEETIKNNNRLQTLMNNLYFPFGYYIKGVVQGKTSNNDGIEYSVLYGDYADEYQTTNFGFIMILDNEYNPVQIFKQYSNQEYFGIIVSLNVGDDGRFYMVEKDNQGYYRFVLLNNILAKSASQEEYQVVMRQTYRFPDQTIVDTSQMMMKKHPIEARYLMAQINSTTEQLNCIELVINVGSTNEWNYYSEDATIYDPSSLRIDDMIASWDSENKLSFIVLTTYTELNAPRYRQFLKTSTSSSIVRSGFLVNLEQSCEYIQSIIKDFNTIYITTSQYANGIRKYYIYLYTGSGGTENLSLIQTINNVNTTSKIGVELLKKDDDIFFYYINTTSFIGLLVNNNVYNSNMEEEPDYNNVSLYLINIQKQFNLYTMYIQVGDYVFSNKLVYIDKNNNNSYQDITSMNPYFAKLYDDNDNLIFARTLYNKNVSGQTTTSIIEVPNQFLNNINIEKQNLFGHTYLSLINNEETYSKNEYEEVYFNFANTWNIQNQNDPNNIILNPSGATRFNQSTSGTNDYDDCKATKFRLNFNDDTSAIYSFNDNGIVQIDNVPPYTYRYTWDVYVPTNKTILSIDIISEDEQTIFQTINNLNLESEKLYTLTQDVYVI